MAKKNAGVDRQDAGPTEEDAGMQAQETDKMPDPPMEEAPAMDHVRIHNLSNVTKDFALTDGKSVRCGPRLPGRDLHISKPVLRKLLAPYIYDVEKLGKIRIEPCAGGEA